MPNTGKHWKRRCEQEGFHLPMPQVLRPKPLSSEQPMGWLLTHQCRKYQGDYHRRNLDRELL